MRCNAWIIRSDKPKAKPRFVSADVPRFEVLEFVERLNGTSRTKWALTEERCNGTLTARTLVARVPYIGGVDYELEVECSCRKCKTTAIGSPARVVPSASNVDEIIQTWLDRRS